MVSLWLMGVASVAAHDGAEELGRVIAVRIPAPIAGLPDRDDRICLSLSPTLQTPDSEFDEGDYGALCESDIHETRACLVVRPGAEWPARFPELVCTGEGHELRATFVPGYDPYDDLSDGVRLVRMVGPDALRKTHYARFVAPGLPDAPGILPSGECGVKDGVLTLMFEQSDDRSRETCTLILDQDSGAELEVDIRLVRRL